MLLAILIPFVLQTLAILVDEFYFHRKRGLPKWERIGHPIDTFSVIACFAFVFLVPYSSRLLPLYAIMAFASCLLVTKDEFVHKEHCTALEQWLHSLLFINHPIVLALLGFMWPIFHEQNSLLAVISQNSAFFKEMVLFQGMGVTIFFFYQVIYWNFYAKDKQLFLR